MKKVIYTLIVISILYYIHAFYSLSGTYVFNKDTNQVDTLILYSNFEYKRIFYPYKSNLSIYCINYGTWEISNRAVYFKNWSNLNDFDTVADNKYIYGTEIQHEFFIGKIRLLINDDLDSYYDKVLYK